MDQLQQRYVKGAPRPDYESVRKANKDWAASIINNDASTDFFRDLKANGQHPTILWIGCSDSRVAETAVLNQAPGTVFTYRCIANVLHGKEDDLALDAVLEYVSTNKSLRNDLKTIILCGHTECGGVKAVLGNDEDDFTEPPQLERWLKPLQKLKDEDDAKPISERWGAGIDDEVQREEVRGYMLTRENVTTGVKWLTKHKRVREMNRNGTAIRGLTYDVGTGLLEEHCHVHERSL
ncbi:MAG: hypothetical protein M1817_002482 [Caeruleum heppii]|nr:MAG: hypothetical protein M1817_002482 [Caeruleum heppii]